MFLFCSSIYFLAMMLVNLTIFLRNLNQDTNYLYFHQAIVISCLSLLIANLSVSTIKCNKSSTSFFSLLYKTIYIIMFLMQLSVTGNLWYQDPNNTIPFFIDFWKMPHQYPFSIIVARIFSSIYILSPLLVIAGIYYLRRNKNSNREEESTDNPNPLLNENPMLSSKISLVV